MKRFSSYIALCLFINPCYSSELVKATSEDIEKLCLSPANPQNQFHVSAWVQTLLYKLIANGGGNLSFDHGPRNVPNQSLLTDRVNYRNCVIEMSRLNALVALGNAKSSNIRVAITDELGASPQKQQHEEQLTLALDGKEYNIVINESNKTAVILADLTDRGQSHGYSIRGYSVESVNEYGSISRKKVSIACQGNIDVSDGDILELKRLDEKSEIIQVCLKKKT